VPGFGLKSVNKILSARRYRRLDWEHLKKIGASLNRAKYFITCYSSTFFNKDYEASKIKGLILGNSTTKFEHGRNNQLSLFG
jgi:predicted DNA-binding helix-hairpin-helix protein